MKKSFQQLMIGTLTKDYQTTLALLKHLKEIGYDEIELNSFMIEPASFLVKVLTTLGGMPCGNGGKLNWNQLIEESKLKVTSLHSDLGSLENNLDKVVAKAKSFNTDTIVITGMYRFDYDKKEALDNLCLRLNTIGEKLAKANLKLLYHNHNVEFLRLDEDTYIYDYIIQNTDPKYVNFEFDSFWCIDSGANPLEIMEKLGSRLKLYHINDRGYSKSSPFMTPLITGADAKELGRGSINLKPLINKAEELGVKSIVLETHRNFIDKSPLKSLEISLEYLNRNI